MVFCNNIWYRLCLFHQLVTILILIDGFLQYTFCRLCHEAYEVTILILIDGFLQYPYHKFYTYVSYVTILILIDGFLQFDSVKIDGFFEVSHNPYFNRWFSAIEIFKNKKINYNKVTILILIDGFLQWQNKVKIWI